MADKKKYYITTAIAYASTKPHFGNTYEIILTDAIARYKRQRGYDVFFLTDGIGRSVCLMPSCLWRRSYPCL